jgi:hypothetical protein
MQMIEIKQPRSVPREILELGNDFTFNKDSLKNTMNKTESSPNTHSRTKIGANKIVKNRARKKSILGRKMLTQQFSLNPKNSSFLNTRNESLFTMKDKAEIGKLFDKLKLYITSLFALIKENNLIGKNLISPPFFPIKSSVSYKYLSVGHAKLNRDLKSFSENWLSTINTYDSMLDKLGRTQKIFYETVKDEFRSYDEVNRGTDQNASTTANNPEDDLDDSEEEFMKISSKQKMRKTDRFSHRPKTGVFYKRHLRDANTPKSRANLVSSRTVDRLFRKDNPKTVTEFLKETKIIKDFCRQEYDNRMFSEVFNAVSNPQILQLRKHQINSMLSEQSTK